MLLEWNWILLSFSWIFAARNTMHIISTVRNRIAKQELRVAAKVGLASKLSIWISKEKTVF